MEETADELSKLDHVGLGSLPQLSSIYAPHLLPSTRMSMRADGRERLKVITSYKIHLYQCWSYFLLNRPKALYVPTPSHCECVTRPKLHIHLFASFDVPPGILQRLTTIRPAGLLSALVTGHCRFRHRSAMYLGCCPFRCTQETKPQLG